MMPSRLTRPLSRTPRRIQSFPRRPPVLISSQHSGYQASSSSWQIRHQSGLTSLTNYMKDVVRTQSLQPSNPILSSLTTVDDLSSDKTTPQLPDFSRILPYHLEKATNDVGRQYKVDLAELEVSLTGVQASEVSQSILERLDRVEAPVVQILQVGMLFTSLASPPDQVGEWQSAYAKALAMNQQLPWRTSQLIYKNLPSDAPPALKLSFEKMGAHLEDPGEQSELQELEKELLSLRQRLKQSPDYSAQPKAVRLQLVSDLYNWIGLSQLQAQKLGHSCVVAMTANQRMLPMEDVLEIAAQVARFLRPHLPPVKLSLVEGAGAFLPSQNNDGPSEEQKNLSKAKFMAKKMFRLHGLLQATSDFYEAIFGIRLQPAETSQSGGWNNKVQVLHLYDIDTEAHLGSIYLDACSDTYWRLESALSLVTTQLFSQNKNQTPVPLAVVALKIKPTWDDAPTPMSWEDVRDMLYQMGKALQLVLSQSRTKTSISSHHDVSEFLASFMEMWVLNDGFVQRVIQLSQDKLSIEDKAIKALRDDWKKEKALDIMQSSFLGSLQLRILSDFDPRGEETLGAMLNRLAMEYIPHQVPDSSDLSPMLALFQDDEDEIAYSVLLSEVLAAMVYDKIAGTDLRDKEVVQKIGREIRDLVSREQPFTKLDVELLCGMDLNSDSLQRVYNF